MSPILLGTYLQRYHNLSSKA